MWYMPIDTNIYCICHSKHPFETQNTLWVPWLGTLKGPRLRPRSRPVMTVVAGCLIFQEPRQPATAVRSQSGHDCRLPPVTATGPWNTKIQNQLQRDTRRDKLEGPGLFSRWLS